MTGEGKKLIVIVGIITALVMLFIGTIIFAAAGLIHGNENADVKASDRVLADTDLAVHTQFSPSQTAERETASISAPLTVGVVGILHSKAYVDEKLCTPISLQSIELTRTDGTTVTGTRAVYVYGDDFSIVYYTPDESCFGYFTVALQKDGASPVYENTAIFSMKMADSETVTGGKLSALGSNYSGRTDGSSYYIEYYYHHLATENCLIGVGVTDLGWLSRSTLSLMGETASELTGGFHLTPPKRELQSAYAECTPNVYSVFSYGGDYDVEALLSSELTCRMAISAQELSLIIK